MKLVVAMAVEKGLSPQKIFDVTQKIKYDAETPDQKYFIKTPKQMLEEYKGICYDIVELQRDLFKKLPQYETKTYISYLKDTPFEKNPTHTFLIYKNKKDGKHYWMESAWESKKGISGPFKSFEEAGKHVSKALGKNFQVKEYPQFDYNNMDIPTFSNYLINGTI